MSNMFQKIAEMVVQKKNTVLVTVIDNTGSTPREKGSRMLVGERGRIAGTIGGGTVEFMAEELAKICVTEKKSCTKSYNLAPNEVADLGMICGGSVVVLFQYLSYELPHLGEMCQEISSYMIQNRNFYVLSSLSETQTVPFVLRNEKTEDFEEEKYFIEEFVAAGKVYIFGGGHVAQALVPILHGLDFYPVVLEDRADFLTADLFPLAKERILVDFKNMQGMIQITDKDYAIVITRCHQFDYDLEKQLLATPAYYIGVMGSKHKAATQKGMLREAGYSKQEINRLHMPIGIKIKAETLAELAISISAELVMKRAEKPEEKK
ncbi:MAG: XdhC family protein [Lachnospiraceae bacterium]|nr:XdhC family protein [Lachnospiraceae bacterium]